MRVARIAILLVALLAGVFAAVLAMNMTRPQQPAAVEAERPAVPTAQVLVAAKDIAVGEAIDADLLSWQVWPVEGAGAYITRTARPDAVSELMGTIAKSSFFAGEPINEAKLVHTDSGYMSAILPSGMRAVATRISADTGAGGFILPNDRVDVIMTRAIQVGDTVESQETRYVPETILNNVRVLAIDQTLEDRNGEKVVVGQTATLELSAQQAQILTVAQQMNDKLTLALRSVTDAGSSAADAANDATYLLGRDQPSGNSGGGVVIVRNGVSTEITARR
jgi:pilus assembly protein CpaB